MLNRNAMVCVAQSILRYEWKPAINQTKFAINRQGASHCWDGLVALCFS